MPKIVDKKTTEGEFSVYQFFADGTYECVSQYVGPEEATDAFKHYTDNVATKLGMVRRVIITDGGDYTNAEWKYGEGLTYPKLDEVKTGENNG